MRVRMRLQAVIGVVMVGALAVGTALTVAPATASAASGTPPTTADLSFTFSGKLGKAAVTGSGSGDVNFTSDALSVTINMPAGISPFMSLVPLPKSLSLTAIAKDTQIEIEVVGGTLYLTMAGLSKIAGKTTVGITFTASTVASLFTGIDDGLANPSVLVAKISRHAKLKPAGKGTVGGTKTKGYKVTVSTKGVLGLIPGLGTLVGSTLTKLVGKTLPIELWTNSAGQVVELSLARGHAKLKAAIDLSNFGAPVTVAAPAAATTLTLPAATLVKAVSGTSSKG